MFGLFFINEKIGVLLWGFKIKMVVMEMDFLWILNNGFDFFVFYVGFDINSMKFVKIKYLGDFNIVIDVKVSYFV